MKRTVIIVLLLSLFTMMTGCSDTKEVSLGSFEGDRYTNDYFGVEITIPEEWTKLDAEGQQIITNAGKEAFVDDEELSKQLDLAEEKVLNFLMAFKYPLEEVHNVNPGVICNAEKLSFLEGVNSGEEYLELSKNLLTRTQIPYEFDKDIYSVELDGHEFYVLESSVSIGEMKIYQKYYSKLINGYAFNIIVTYSEEEGKGEIEEIVKTVKFDW